MEGTRREGGRELSKKVRGSKEGSMEGTRREGGRELSKEVSESIGRGPWRGLGGRVGEN